MFEDHKSAVTVIVLFCEVTVFEALINAPELEKQLKDPCKKLSSGLLWTGSTAKSISAT